MSSILFPLLFKLIAIIAPVNKAVFVEIALAIIQAIIFRSPFHTVSTVMTKAERIKYLRSHLTKILFDAVFPSKFCKPFRLELISCLAP